MSTHPLHYGPYNNHSDLDAGDTADTTLVVDGIPVLETILIASLVTAASLLPVNIGGTVLNTAEVFNGAIPGPTFRLTVGRCGGCDCVSFVCRNSRAGAARTVS